MAELQENTEEEKPKKAGMSTPTLIGVIAGVVILQVIIVFVIFKVFVTPSAPSKGEKNRTENVPDDEESHNEESIVRVREIREIVATEDMILNPRGSSSRYVLLALGLEVDSPDAVKVVEEKLMIPIQHTTRSYIGRFSVEDLERQTLIDSLPNQLRKQLQPYFGEHKLRNVYIKKFIVQ